jgi:hypothetical protein
MAMPARKPQINFQVEPAMKQVYNEAKAGGQWVARLCAAGFLLMVEDAELRRHAINRLREWEAHYGGASPEKIRAFVEAAQDAMQAPSRGSAPGRTPRKARKKARRSGS